MRIVIAAVAVGLSISACSGSSGDAGMPADSASMSAAAAPMPAADTATATVKDADGRDLGTLTLTDVTGGIQLEGMLSGLPPGEHAIHLHTVGQCEAPFTSAGGHWNPTGRQHGAENPEGPHFGDLPNIWVPADSGILVLATTHGGTLRGKNGLLDDDGAAVVVHAGLDDYRTDPAGDAGARIACGVVVAR